MSGPRLKRLLVAIVVVIGAGIPAAAWAAALGLTTPHLTTLAVAAPVAYPTSMSISTGTGQPSSNDKITINFSRLLLLSTMCSNITNNGSTTTNVALTFSDGGSGNDTVTITKFDSYACTPHFGTIVLGSGAYLTGGATSTFDSSPLKVTQGTTSSVQITIGTKAPTPGAPGTYASASIATYVADAGVTDTTGNSLGNNAVETVSAVQF